MSVTCDRSEVFFGYSSSSTNKTDCHDITEILLKVALNTIKQTKPNEYENERPLVWNYIWSKEGKLVIIIQTWDPSLFVKSYFVNWIDIIDPFYIAAPFSWCLGCPVENTGRYWFSLSNWTSFNIWNIRLETFRRYWFFSTRLSCSLLSRISR